MATTTTTRSTFEEEIQKLRDTHGITESVGDPLGPRAFVNDVIERADALRARKSVRPFLSLRANDLSLAFLKDVEKPWQVVSVLYVRAFQSMQSRSALKAFVVALGDGRLSATPVRLSKIDPIWCDEQHELYAHCWGQIARTDDELAQKARRSEQAVGKLLLKQLLKASGMDGNKAVQPIVARLSKHAPTVELVGRLARLMREGNTSAIMQDAIAHAQALYTSGQIDMAALAREAMRTVRKHGVDPSESIDQMSALLGKFTNKTQ